jgi:hypothetical protein
MLSKWVRTVLLPFIVAATFVGTAFGQDGYAPLLLHYTPRSTALPVAIYRNIKIDDLRTLVIGAFEGADFSLTSITRTKDGVAQFIFSYPMVLGSNSRNIALVLKLDENLDKDRRCERCFLRQALLTDVAGYTNLPWMTQYEASSRIFPDIDRAFAKIRTDGQKYMDAEVGFQYKNFWQGEKNLYGNSFSGISLTALKAATVDSYHAAGFVPMGEAQRTPDSVFSRLIFSFPIASDQTGGVVYEVLFASQFDASGSCNPCEMEELLDPYQQLPAAGLSGMASRLTLESRFSAARALAFDKLKDATERYLRPRSTFTVPPKSAPLGSPRPPMVMPAVT